VADGSRVAGGIIPTLLTKMEAGPPTEATTGRGVTTTRRSEDNRQRRDGMKYERPTRILAQEGERKETAACCNNIIRQEGDGATGVWQRRGQVQDGVDPTQTEHPGTPDQTSQTVDPTWRETNP
jgi:hypothetical protein